MNKLAKVKYLKQIIEELEKELEKDQAIEVNTAKDAVSIDKKLLPVDGTVNSIEDILNDGILPLECDRGDKICLAVKIIAGLSILAIIIAGLSFA